MAELMVVSGPPGSGKSTVGRLLSARFALSALVVGDAFFEFLDRGAVPPWEPGSDGQNEIVVRAAASAAGRFVWGGYDVVYDGVVGPWFVDTFAAWTGLDRIHYAVLLPSEQECVDRVRARPDHPFTDESATRHMHREFAGARIDARHVLDGAGGPDVTAAAIQAALADGRLAR